MAEDEAERVADVVLLAPVGRVYSYAVPPSMHVERGCQVLCPLKTARVVNGIVWNVRGPRQDDPVLRPLAGVVSERRPWPMELLETIDFVARYYVAPLGSVARVAMPRLFARRRPKTVTLIRVSDDSGDTPLRSERQEELVEQIRAQGEMEIREASRLVKNGRDVVRRLLRRGVLKLREVPAHEWGDEATVAPHSDAGSQVELQLTDHQRHAYDTIVEAVGRGYKAFVLHGVTGSGKTEVYLRAIERALDLGKGALFLVPEIALTVELRRTLRQRFGEAVAVVHSGLSPAKRADYWDMVLAGACKIVVGARSAVFAPVRDLGLIVVDEEHDTSYKQMEGLRYNARDVAIVRGTFAQCTVVLGSATPSLESYHNARIGKATYISMPSRVKERPMPEVDFVDLRYNPPIGRHRLLSNRLLTAVRETIERGESCILFLNRRGFARVMLCGTCGARLQCPNCSISLTFHKNPRRLACHYCDYRSKVPSACPLCGSKDLSLMGMGTERVEEDIGELVPGARCVRLDSDSATGSRMDRILWDFRSGKANVLVGTQMVAKGHDFPSVTLVGVLLAEQTLCFPDFRSAERTFQLLTQVAGRAGRGDVPGRVLVQTFDPRHYALMYAAKHDYLGFAVAELEQRKLRGYPPLTRLATVEVRSPEPAKASEEACRVAVFMKDLVRREGLGDKVVLLGPAYASLERLKGETRLHVMLKTTSPRALNKCLGSLFAWVGKGRGKTRVIIDVDPATVL